MGGETLVSIMMPCFDAEQTLPMALASLRAQSYENWEAVIVDDGSSDGTWDLLKGVGDPRLRLERFDANRGRGAARQRCLEMADGELLAFLDADDWLFPRKLAHQVSLMQEHPNLVAVSGTSIVTDAAGEAVGQMSSGLAPGEELTSGVVSHPGPPPLDFPPCMVRMEAARSAGFNPEFRRSQDSDFLIRVLLGRSYAVSSIPVYAYSQAEAASLDKTLDGYRFRIRCYQQYAETYPVRARMEIVKTFARIAVYKAAGATGVENRLIERRWRHITPDAKSAYEAAKASVSRAVEMKEAS